MTIIQVLSLILPLSLAYEQSHTQHQQPTVTSDDEYSYHSYHSSSSEEEEENRIFGGLEVEAGTYPWFVRGTDVYGRWMGCGGSLITPEFILTAAHCGWDPDYNLFQIGALCSPYGHGSNCGQPAEIMAEAQQVFVHPSYNLLPQSNPNDLALIHLKSQSNIEPVPIDLGDLSTSYTGGEKLWTVGFGITEFGDLPDRLQHVEVSYVTTEVCNDPSSYNGLIDDSMMCAADFDKDSCRGDSGGPLYDKKNDRLVGIVSWGLECALPSHPGVYSRIADQYEWIKTIVCEHHSSENYPKFCLPAIPTVSPAPSTSPYPTEEPTIQRLQSTIITNGVIMLGIHKEGHLNVQGPPEDYLGLETVGLRYYRDNGWFDSTSYGTPSEGYGISATRTSDGYKISGGANVYGGLFSVFGISSPYLVSDGVSATSTVTVDDMLLVTHEFRPSSVSENLYQITVTYENLLTDDTLTELRYRRALDWDITPSLYTECVSILFDSFPSGIEYITDDGFETMDPLVDVSSSYISFSCKEEGVGGCNDMIDNGPVDHGSLFQFLFQNEGGILESLGPGEKFSFDLFYGAVPTLNQVNRVMSDANIAIASIAYPPKDIGCRSLNDGSPNIFIAGFRGVGERASSCVNNPLFTFITVNGTKKCSSIYFFAPSTKERTCAIRSIQRNCRAACDLCCGNNDNFTFKGGKKTCSSLSTVSDSKRSKWCEWNNVKRNCPKGCKVCSNVNKPPTVAPSCDDDPSFTFTTYGDKVKRCSSIYFVAPPTKDKYCSMTKVREACPSACTTCCGNNQKFTFKGDKTCDSLMKEDESKRDKYCKWENVRHNCRKSCNVCDDE